MNLESQYGLNILEYIREQKQIDWTLVDEMDIVALLGLKCACREGMAFVLDNKCCSMEHAWHVCENYYDLHWMLRRLIPSRHRWVWLAACHEINRQMTDTPFKDNHFEGVSSLFCAVQAYTVDGVVWLKRLPNPMTLYPMKNELRGLIADFRDLYTAVDTDQAYQFAILLHEIFACRDARSWVLSNGISSAKEAWEETNNTDWLRWMLHWMLPRESGMRLTGMRLRRELDRLGESVVTADRIRGIIPNPFENGWDMIPSLARKYVSHLESVLGSSYSGEEQS